MRMSPASSAVLHVVQAGQMLTPVGHASAPCPAQVMVLNIHEKLKAMQQHSAGECTTLNNTLGISQSFACWIHP